MTTYLATVTVTVVGDLSAEEAAGMSDALGASDHSVMPGRVVLHVPGEAPDLLTATAAAHRHAAEVLDEYPFEIDVEEHPAF
ncbi:hypothetical protein [Cellulomonas sp. ATA003]|uniref:hypothetical protein n=1 Tax=Cellulomonas sp. ATA003 TaxID=3073064 RepID=UPI0028735FF7|nr:hypothetical protein [Cellulomonas sp. ATA003]WNB85330.1 hypothetical protein REH70_17235 [Cellulomonas sp. ATA003]